MADSTILVKKYLLKNPALVAMLGGQNIFGGELPEKFDVTVKPAITISTEGGNAYQEAPIAQDRVRIRIWAGINQHALARQVYDELSKWLHGKNLINLAPDGFIIISQESVRGSDLTDPEEGYATVLAWYEVTTRESSPETGIPFSIAHGLGALPSSVSIVSLVGDTTLGTPGFDLTNLYLTSELGGMIALVYVYPDPGPLSGDFYVPYGLVTIPTVGDPTVHISDWEGTSYDSIPLNPEITAIVLVYL